jgi:hypothetical protein
MNAIRRVTYGAVAGALLLGTSACGDSGDPSGDGGPVRVSLATPSADDGALVITVTGPALSAVRPASSSYSVFWRVVNDQETRVIVVGNIVDGGLFTATPPDGVAASELTAAVMEVASRTDVLRPNVEGYSLSVAR